jgi:hypothetical protein
MTGVDVSAVATSTVRVAAHVHSEWSDDGSWPLSRIAETFGRKGYSVVLMSEHSRGFTSAKWLEYMEACEQAGNGQVTLVPGIEYGDEDDVVHIPVWGRVPFFGEAPQTGALLAEVSQAGGTAVWAHPWRRAAWKRFDPRWSEHLGAIEVWNRKYDGIAPNRKSLDLSRREGAPAFVSLDFHTRRQLFPLSLALRLACSSGEQAADPSSAITIDRVYDALQSGSFSPRAFGLELERLTAGPPAAVLAVLESSRRAVARLVRLAMPNRGPSPPSPREGDGSASRSVSALSCPGGGETLVRPVSPRQQVAQPHRMPVEKSGKHESSDKREARQRYKCSLRRAGSGDRTGRIGYRPELHPRLWLCSLLRLERREIVLHHLHDSRESVLGGGRIRRTRRYCDVRVAVVRKILIVEINQCDVIGSRPAGLLDLLLAFLTRDLSGYQRVNYEKILTVDKQAALSRRGERNRSCVRISRVRVLNVIIGARRHNEDETNCHQMPPDERHKLLRAHQRHLDCSSGVGAAMSTCSLSAVRRCPNSSFIASCGRQPRPPLRRGAHDALPDPRNRSEQFTPSAMIRPSILYSAEPAER